MDDTFALEKVRLKVLGIAPSFLQQDTFALVLKEAEGERELTILVGMLEAQAIALALEDKHLVRPKMHDLFRDTLVSIDYVVKDVIITELQDRIFYAKMVLSDGENLIAIDARPSDAIAIGLRFGAGLWIYASLFDTLHTSNENTAMPSLQPSSTAPQDIKNHSVTSLKKMLQSAVEKEDYEQAAALRDELRRRN